MKNGLPLKLYELDRQPHIDHLTSVFIPAQEQTVVQHVNALQEEKTLCFDDDDDFTVISRISAMMLNCFR